MKRVISSKDTFFYKIILPVFFLIGGAVLPAVIYFDDKERFAAVLPPEIYAGDKNGHFAAAVFVLLLMLLFAGIIFLMTKKLKKLSLDDNFLYVSNYLKETPVPLSNIAEIRWVSDMYPAMIYLKTPAGRKKRINFYPNVRVKSDETNPIVEELKGLANSNKSLS